MRLFVWIILFFSTCALRAQDTLIFKSGEILAVKMIGLDPEKAQYKMWANQDGPLYLVPRKEIQEIHYADGKREINPGKFNLNFYIPFVRTVPPTVSDFGVYVFVGLGKGVCESHSGFATFQSVTLAYKSHLFSVSRSRIAEFGAVYGGRDPYFESSYIGFLIGESVRMKYGLLSLSAGVATTGLTAYRKNEEDYNYDGFSVPIELKLCGLVYNGVGAGIAITGNVLPGKKYSQLMVTGTLVFGKWNKLSSDL